MVTPVEALVIHCVTKYQHSKPVQPTVQNWTSNGSPFIHLSQFLSSDSTEPCLRLLPDKERSIGCPALALSGYCSTGLPWRARCWSAAMSLADAMCNRGTLHSHRSPLDKDKLQRSLEAGAFKTSTPFIRPWMGDIKLVNGCCCGADAQCPFP